MSTEKNGIEVGSIAPEFTLEAKHSQVSLASYRGQRHVVLFFVREFHCQICQRHAANLARLYPRLQAHDTEVVVIGGGEREEAERMAHRLKLPFPVAADHDRVVYQQYGLDKALFVIQRSAIVLIDKQGIVRYLNRAINPNAALDEAALMSAVGQLAIASPDNPTVQNANQLKAA